MYLALSNSLGGSSRGQDPSAADYIAAVRAAGATVTSTQVGAINTFYKTAKSGTYYTSLKRLYLPIWGVAAANAIDMIGLTSGTWSGGVTHGAGYAQGDGSTGYFSHDVFTPQPTTGAQGCLIKQKNSGSYQGYIESMNGFILSDDTPTNFYIQPYNTATILYATDAAGIVITEHDGGEVRSMHRKSSGFFFDDSSSGGYEYASNVTLLWGSTASGNYGDSQIGAFFVGTSLGITNATNFTLHLKNLWETCTQLSLP